MLRLGLGLNKVRTRNVGARAGGAIEFVYHDEFSLDEAAPLASPRAWLTLVQTDGQMSIAGSMLSVPAQGTPVWTDLGFYAPAVTRGAGLLLAQAIKRSFPNKQFYVCQFKTAGSVGAVQAAHGFQSDTDGNFIFDNSVQTKFGADFMGFYAPTADETIYGVVLRTSGAYYLVGDALVYVGEGSSAATLYPHNANYDNVYTSDYVRLVQLGAPFVASRGLATFYDATPTADDTAVGTADGQQYIKWTPGAGETLDLMYRRVDDNNTMILRCSQAGGWIRVYQKKAGVETQITTAAQTWTVGSVYRIGLRYDWRYHHAWVNGGWKWQTTSGNWNTYNLYETGTKISGGATLTDWESYPAYLTGVALTEYRKYTSPYVNGYRTREVINVADGGDLNAAIATMRQGDILSLAPNGNYTLAGGANGFSGFRGGFSETHRSEIRGNGATITGGGYGARLANIRYFKVSDLNFVDQTVYNLHVVNCRHFEFENCTFQSDAAPAGFYDCTHFDQCRDGLISNCTVLDSAGIASMDGFEVYGDCQDIIFNDCEAGGVVNGFEVWTGVAPAGANKNIQFNRCYAHDCTVGFSCEGANKTPLCKLMLYARTAP